MNFFIGSTSEYGTFGRTDAARRAFLIAKFLKSGSAPYLDFQQVRTYLEGVGEVRMTPNKIIAAIILMIDKNYKVESNPFNFYESRIYKKK